MATRDFDIRDIDIQDFDIRDFDIRDFYIRDFDIRDNNSGFWPITSENTNFFKKKWIFCRKSVYYGEATAPLAPLGSTYEPIENFETQN